MFGLISDYISESSIGVEPSIVMGALGASVVILAGAFRVHTMRMHARVLDALGQLERGGQAMQTVPAAPGEDIACQRLVEMDSVSCD